MNGCVASGRPEFAPHRIEATIEAMAAADEVAGAGQAIAQAHGTIRDCDGKMARYRAAAWQSLTEV